MPEQAGGFAGPVFAWCSRLGSFIIVAACLWFIADKLWALEWGTLGAYSGWRLGSAMLAASALFVAADHALARSWAASADPGHRLSAREIWRIYGHGVLTKYLPGSIFQYASRHAGGGKAGLGHRRIARSTFVEIGFHLVASLMVAATCWLAHREGLFALAIPVLLIGVCRLSRRPHLVALAWQLAAFSAYAAAAGVIGAAVLNGEGGLVRFAGIYLLAWLAGYVVPVAPSGIGVREAVLIALGGAAFPATAVVAATLALRVASITGDLAYGLSGQSWRTHQGL